MSDIFKEVDEDLRREQFKRLWDRYGPYVIGLAILIVVATAGYRGWEYWQEKQAQATGDRFLSALDLAQKGEHDKAIAALKDIESNGSGSYPVLAGFRVASEIAATGKSDEAIAEYDSDRRARRYLRRDQGAGAAARRGAAGRHRQPRRPAEAPRRSRRHRQRLAPQRPRTARLGRVASGRPGGGTQVFRRDRPGPGGAAGPAPARPGHALADHGADRGAAAAGQVVAGPGRGSRAGRFAATAEL